MSLPPSEIPLGAMRFNSDSQKLEYWMGSAWMQIKTFSPNFSDGSVSGEVVGGVRAMTMGGVGPAINHIQFFNMATPGDATDFGDLPYNQTNTASTASRTRAVALGGYDPSPGAYISKISAVEIAANGVGFDFGDLTQTAGYTGAVGNQTRAVRVGGTGPANPSTKVMDHVTISNIANAKSFGDLDNAGTSNSCNVNNSVRGIIHTSFSADNDTHCEFISIPTLGDGQLFGDLVKSRSDGSGMSNSTRGIFNGGYVSPGLVTFMEYVTISTTGNGTTVGDLTNVTFREGGHASPVRGVISGGMGVSPYPTLDILQSVNFATEGDAVDFGDLDKARYEHASISNGHGGLG